MAVTASVNPSASCHAGHAESIQTTLVLPAGAGVAAVHVQTERATVRLRCSDLHQYVQLRVQTVDARLALQAEDHLMRLRVDGVNVKALGVRAWGELFTTCSDLGVIHRIVGHDFFVSRGLGAERPAASGAALHRRVRAPR